MTEAEREAFVRAHTRLVPAAHVPEVRLHLTGRMTALWEMTEEALRARDLPPPFWAFAWAGGQALSRYLLDHPQEAAGRRVLDLGAGSGLVGIAAALAGAAQVTAVDVDLFAVTAARLNAHANGVALDLVCADILDGEVPPADLLLAGDIAYEQPMADRLRRFLRRAHEGGARVLIGDPGRVYFTEGGLIRLAEYEVPTDREIEELDAKRTRVFALA